MISTWRSLDPHVILVKSACHLMMIPEDAGYKEVKELNFQTRSVAKGIGVLKVLKKLV